MSLFYADQISKIIYINLCVPSFVLLKGQQMCVNVLFPVFFQKDILSPRDNFSMTLTGYSFFQTIPAHQSERRYICNMLHTEMTLASSVTKDAKTVTIATENMDFILDFTDINNLENNWCQFYTNYKRTWTRWKANRWGLCALRHGIQISMEAILACHLARSTEWLDCHPKLCELWQSRTGLIVGSRFRHQLCTVVQGCWHRV